MGINLVNASSQKLSALSSFTTTLAGTTVTLACWFRTTTIAAGTVPILNFGQAAGGDYVELRRTAATLLASWTTSGGTKTGNTISGLATNTWYFVLGRFINPTGGGSRFSLLSGTTGAITHATNTNTSASPFGTLDTMTIGGRSGTATAAFFDGIIAEFWLANGDVQPDGTQTEDWFVRQLAWNGPFSCPHIIPKVVEYRSLRAALDATQSNTRELFTGPYGMLPWTQSNSPTISFHPSLIGQGYRTPRGNRSSLIVPI
jgi:hypothetical protein